MKLEKQLNKKNIQSLGKVTAMKLDEDAHATIFDIFTSGLYSDPIGSIIREITSNCFDSHIEAGNDSPKNPVVIRLTKEVSGNFISFIDNGVGMSPDRVHNIYGTYFKSTKTSTNKQNGAFGLGGKTPLAYTDSFFVITRHNKIKYTYNVFMGNDSPMIELMSQETTKKVNGTEVKIPVKESDIDEFEKKTLRQLFYFENIIFEGYSDYHVTNDYTIVKGKTFLYRGDNYSEFMHVCLGNVAYPINYEALGLSKYDYKLPVAIKIAIGELDGTAVTRSREELKYTDSNKKIIKKKMDAVKAEMIELISKQYDNVQTIEDYYETIGRVKYLKLDGDRSIYLNDIEPNDVVFPNFKYNDLNMPKYEELIDVFYETKRFGKKPRRYNSSYQTTFESMVNYPIYYVDGEFKRVVLKQSYLGYEYDTFYIHTPKKLDEDRIIALKRRFGLTTTKEVPVPKNMQTGNSLLDTKTKTINIIPKKKADKLINDFFSVVHKIMVSKSENYDDLVVPDEYVKLRKESRMSATVLKTGIPMKDRSGYGNRTKRTMQQLLDHKGKIYYGFNDDDYILKSSSSIFSEISGSNYINRLSNWGDDQHKGTMFVSISKGNEKYFKMLGKKAIHISNFYETYVSRKIDLILENNAKAKVETMYTDNVLPVFHNHKIFKHIDKEIFDVATKVNDSLETHQTYYNINIDKVLQRLGIHLDNVQVEFKFKEELKWLTDISEGCKNRLEWFNFPYEIDTKNDSHKELIEMVNLCIDK